MPRAQATDQTCPLSKSAVIERYFMEHRAKAIDIAAFLDRLDRADDDLGGQGDFRVKALRDAIAILQEDTPLRARRILELFSDHSTEPIPSAAGMKGAVGVQPPGTSA